MGRIKGHYEWDDDDLTPGKKREGGLHQNLFDSEGHLKGNARFVPDDSLDDEPFIVTETVYVPVEERRRTPEQEALEAAIADLIENLIDRGIARLKPHVNRFVQETARPYYDGKVQVLRESRARRKARKSGTAIEVAENQPDHTAVETTGDPRPDMSKAEAQARYLAALAAQAYSDEQMRLVNDANIVDCDGLPELQRSLAELPADQVAALLKAMATKPQMMQESALAELASILGRSARSHAIEMGPA
ncbi:hypothetical protein IDH50_03170 [Aeromicrobium tamlense]|uniref:Uncharacterized protein n=1 Tax=Aeromicrobium tamlense TaxID=375541 RepID=A0A8I0KH85_9ACTN|nr:hypothetical protein [Aeromicrobium tamlense]MBD1269225.1 hypothetical protein [Aeromicrobium tamlense]NYI36866.1 hypothetical protein [Aeromicrobium tamlense]